MKKRLVALIMVLASTVSLTTSGFAANVNCKSDQFTSATEYAYNTDTETNVNSARVEEYATEDYTFETLNYFLDSYDLLDNDSAADIDNYLLVSE